MLTFSKFVNSRAGIHNSRTILALHHDSFLQRPLFAVSLHPHTLPAKFAVVRYYTSPIKTFIDTFREQIKKNKELQHNIKQLQDQSDQLVESDAMRRAREVYQKAKEQTTTHGTEKLKSITEELAKRTSKITEAASQTIKDASETEFVKEAREAASKAAESVSKATEPILQNPIVNKVTESVKQAAEDPSGKYTGFLEKETRRKLREERLKNDHDVGGVGSKDTKENPDAGEALVLHKDSAWKESWNKFKDTNPFMQGLFRARRNYDESDNLFISYSRAFTDRVAETFGSIFEENDQAQAIKAFQRLDPRFNMEQFLKEAREYIVPEVMDAYLKGDSNTLRQWCSEATYNVLTAVMQAQMQQGLVPDCRIQDLRDVELVTAKILDNDVPVLVLSFRTQEVIVFRNAKTREIIYGKEDHIEQATYACVLTKTEEDLVNPVTGGWRVIDMAKHDSRPIW